MTTAEEHIPSPADVPEFTAAELLEHISSRGGRIFRTQREATVFILTQDAELASDLVRMGSRRFIPSHLSPNHLGPNGAYKRSKNGPWEWDVIITGVPVAGEETLWQAAGAYRNGKPK